MTDPLAKLEPARRQLIIDILDMPFHRFADLRLIDLGPDEARIGFRATKALLTPGGYLHGGIMAGLLEPVTLLASVMHLSANEMPVTIDEHVQHLRAVRADAEVVVVGRMLRRSKRLLFCESEALVHGERMSVARMTKAINTLDH